MRFNLFSLFLATTVVAVFVAILFALPAFLAGALTFFLIGAIPAILSCGVYFGTGRTKAFCLGASIPLLPNLFFSYFMITPSIFVAEEINWWNPSNDSTSAMEAFEIIYNSWNHVGHAVLAAQIPAWVVAFLCGICAVAGRNWFRDNR